MQVTLGICGVEDYLKPEHGMAPSLWRVANIVMGGALMIACDRIKGLTYV